MKLKRLLTLLLIIFVNIEYSSAGTSSTTFGVKIQIGNSCVINANSLNFGNYTIAALNATTSLSVTCTANASAKIGLSAGNGSGSTTTTRKMAYNGNLLNYKLYQDSNRTINWGNSPPKDTVNITGTGFEQTITIYGQIPAGQAGPIGNYSDVIVATITFS